MRADLVALAEEDLVEFSSRGAFNRAAKEASGGALTCELAESSDGAVRAVWSDGWIVEIPPQRTIREARCSCLAVGVCRHLVRTVLHYQRSQQAAAPTGPWDPGSITDEVLARALPASALAEARRIADAGVLAELVRSGRPLARFHGTGCNVRFRVPHDLQYATADCAPSLAPAWIAVAVWTFRRLPPAERAGFVVTGEPVPAPVATLDDVDRAARAWFVHGLDGAPPHFHASLERLEAACAGAGLVWPAANVAAVHEEAVRYAARDALFSPEHTIEQAGELLGRADAIRAATGAVPQPLVRGTARDRVVEIAAARFVGLGCLAVTRRLRVDVTAYFQDLASGEVSVIAREFPHDPRSSDPPRVLHRLAEVPVAQGLGLGQLSRSLVTVSRAKRAAAGALVLGRNRIAAVPQGWAWESVREPVLVEDYDELRARIAALPPAALRPMRAADGFHVLAVAGVEAPRFDVATQRVLATLRDADGRAAVLSHPYVSRASEGCDRLLAALGGGSGDVRFVAGRVALTSLGLTIAPAAVVFGDVGSRTAVLPWTDRAATADDARGEPQGSASSGVSSTVSDPLRAHIAELTGALASLLQVGLRRADDAVARRWRELARAGESVGLGLLPPRVSSLAAEVERRLRDPRWDPIPAATLACELAVLLRIAPEFL